MTHRAVLSALTVLLVACGSGETAPNPGGPPSCSGGGLGGLGCICAAGTCTCSGLDACDSICGDGCVVTCNNTAGCTAACGTDCTATCNGTNDCAFHVGMGSEIVCNGTGSCDTICEGGACRATCNAGGGCVLRCPVDGGCEMICGAGPPTDCGEGIQACGSTCP